MIPVYGRLKTIEKQLLSSSRGSANLKLRILGEYIFMGKTVLFAFTSAFLLKYYLYFNLRK